MRIRPEFLRILNQTVDLAKLEESRHTIFAMTSELRLAYYNPAWQSFAELSGAPRMAEAWPLGRPLMAAVPAQLRSFYVSGYAEALASGHPWETEYLAPTPRRNRSYIMRVQALGSRAGLLVTNLLRVDEPWAHEGHSADDRRYRCEDGFVRQCVSCQQFSVAEASDGWERVTAWFTLPPPRLRSTLCPDCVARHYPVRAQAA